MTIGYRNQTISHFFILFTSRLPTTNATILRIIRLCDVFLIFRTESSNFLLDPHLICKKSRRLRGKHHEMCKNEAFIMREISRGISMGFKECEHQFKHHRWNCTSITRSMRKILLKGKSFDDDDE